MSVLVLFMVSLISLSADYNKVPPGKFDVHVGRPNEGYLRR